MEDRRDHHGATITVLTLRLVVVLMVVMMMEVRRLLVRFPNWLGNLTGLF